METMFYLIEVQKEQHLFEIKHLKYKFNSSLVNKSITFLSEYVVNISFNIGK